MVGILVSFWDGYFKVVGKKEYSPKWWFHGDLKVHDHLIQTKDYLVVFFATHLKNKLVKLDNFPNFRDEHKTCFKPPPR